MNATLVSPAILEAIVSGDVNAVAPDSIGKVKSNGKASKALKGKEALAALQLSDSQAQSLVELAKFSFILSAKIGKIKHDGEASLLARGGSAVKGMSSDKWKEVSKEDRKVWDDARKVQAAFLAAGVTPLVKL